MPNKIDDMSKDKRQTIAEFLIDLDKIRKQYRQILRGPRIEPEEADKELEWFAKKYHLSAEQTEKFAYDGHWPITELAHFMMPPSSR